jgi:diaminopimelate epimerase
MTAFLKMHGLGNDFAIFDARKQDLVLDETTAKAVADRRFGIGCDQVIVIEKSPKADAFMRVFNADGGIVESCGNATRCVARLLMDEKGKSEVRIDTLGGLLVCTDAEDGAVTVDMGEPGLAWDEVPLARPTDTNTFSLNVDGTEHIAAAVSTGNPHCVLFVEDAERAAVERIGARIEHHPMFPERTNVEFVTPLSRDRLRMRVWERGVGVTVACGTGACATAVAAHRRGLADRKVEVVLDGGVLGIEWRERDGHVLMTGPSTLTYKGDIDLKALA